MSVIERVEVETLLSSCGSAALGITLCVSGGIRAFASAPSALVPGRREQPRCAGGRFDGEEVRRLSGLLTGSLTGLVVADQAAFDARVSALKQDWQVGSEVTLGLSLAHLRALSMLTGSTFLESMLSITGKNGMMPTPLVNLFSGGVHDPSGRQPFQQIMLIPTGDCFRDKAMMAMEVYDGLFESVRRSGNFRGLGSSSGMLMNGVPYQSLFELVREEIDRRGLGSDVSLGIDVAAEHLQVRPSIYRFGNEEFDANAVRDLLCRLVDDFGISFVEDPFDSDDEASWRGLVEALDGKAVVVGDDLFATNAAHLRDGVAGGIIVKMNQVGTLSDTFRAVDKAESLGMIKCVSHRSCETEDTAMVDLSVAIGAELVKLGGPRRGDRVAKYNRFLRIERELEARG